MAKNAAKAKAAKKAEKAAKMVKVNLPRDYRDHDGTLYGPGLVEVPADSTIATFGKEVSDA